MGNIYGIMEKTNGNIRHVSTECEVTAIKKGSPIKTRDQTPMGIIKETEN